MKSGWTDLIPARGEAEAAIKLKGAYGGRGGSMYRRTKRSKFSSLRKVPKGRRAEYAIPLGVGESMDSPDISQLHIAQSTGGSTVDGIHRQWMFVIHPGIRPAIGTTPVLPWMMGQSNTSEEARYRVLGLQGKIHWRPLTTGTEDAFPLECCGYIAGAWYKLRRSDALNVDGVTVLENSIYNRFPWRSLNAVDSLRTAVEGAGFGINDSLTNANVQLGTDQFTTASMDAARAQVRIGQQTDWRLADKSPIGQFCVPWKAEYVPRQWVWSVSADDFAKAEPAEMGASAAVSIPLPRKLIANVGGDEALGFYFMSWNVGDNTSVKHPIGRMDYPTFRVKLLELD